jgi:hypothetical protein
MGIVNKPEVSRAIALMYEALFIFIAAIAALFLYLAIFTPMGAAGIIASIGSAFVGLVILSILLSLYQTRYILTNQDLIVKATKLIGGSKTVPLQTVRSVEKTMIPFGIRLFGASFHGGYYHIPGLGRAFLTITNFKDGLLIKTDRGNYIITPSNPLGFKEDTERAMKNHQKSTK